MRAAILILALLWLTGPAELRAQAGAPPREGDRVRLVSPQMRGTFRVVAVDGQALVLQPADSGPALCVALETVERLAVDPGPRSRWAGARHRGTYGLVMGAAAGAVVGLVDGDDTCRQGDWCIFHLSAEEKALMGAVLFGGAGAAVGLVAGALHPGHRWERVELPLRLSVGPARAGGLALAAVVRF